MKNTQLPVLTKEYQRQAAGMIRQYADKLIQMGYGFTRRQLKEMNYIDVQEFFEKKSNHNSMKREYLDLGKTIPQDQYFYYLIPCYKEGVFYIGMDQYMYWQVKDISMMRFLPMPGIPWSMMRSSCSGNHRLHYNIS